MGMNSVSIFIHYPAIESQESARFAAPSGSDGDESQPVAAAGYALQFEWDKMRALIERYRLWDNGTVYTSTSRGSPCLATTRP